MLIVCNGAAKSGSTWLYNIVARLQACDWPDQKYLTRSKKHPTIRPDALESYLREQDFSSRHVITKTHYGSWRLRDLLLARPDTRVIDMDRNLYDVIVSTYFDACRRDGFQGSFADFYWLEGRAQANYLIQYHALWGEKHPQVLVTSFEGLKTQFRTEVRRIADFLDVTVSDEQISQIERDTSIDSLREQYSDDPQYADNKIPFFRKGVIGDWKNHFDEPMLKDIRNIERSGITRFDRIEFANRFKRQVHRYFPRLSPYRKSTSAI